MAVRLPKDGREFAVEVVRWNGGERREGVRFVFWACFMNEGADAIGARSWKAVDRNGDGLTGGGKDGLEGARGGDGGSKIGHRNGVQDEKGKKCQIRKMAKMELV